MRFLLDENFPKSAGELLDSLGHEVIDFRNEGEIGADDTEVVQLVLQHSAVILSTDRDFFHTLGRAYPEHHGIIVIALRRPTRRLIIERLKWALDNVPSGSIRGCAFQLRDNAWQVYPPLEEEPSEQ